jgi:hypothetical protein
MHTERFTAAKSLSGTQLMGCVLIPVLNPHGLQSTNRTRSESRRWSMVPAMSPLTTSPRYSRQHCGVGRICEGERERERERERRMSAATLG